MDELKDFFNISATINGKFSLVIAGENQSNSNNLATRMVSQCCL